MQILYNTDTNLPIPIALSLFNCFLFFSSEEALYYKSSKVHIHVWLELGKK